eukprot:6216826-Prymnesium_polylepis.1
MTTKEKEAIAVGGCGRQERSVYLLRNFGPAQICVWSVWSRCFERKIRCEDSHLTAAAGEPLASGEARLAIGGARAGVDRIEPLVWQDNPVEHEPIDTKYCI